MDPSGVEANDRRILLLAEIVFQMDPSGVEAETREP